MLLTLGETQPCVSREKVFFFFFFFFLKETKKKKKLIIIILEKQEAINLPLRYTAINHAAGEDLQSQKKKKKKKKKKSIGCQEVR